MPYAALLGLQQTVLGICKNYFLNSRCDQNKNLGKILKTDIRMFFTTPAMSQLSQH
jgi:hypothetical protein